MSTYPIHPYASCWAKPDNFEEIKSSIKDVGQIDPITLFEGQVLDGVQRYTICQELGIDPRFHTPEISNPLQYVLAKNKNRRHATKSQISMAVVKMANLAVHGSNQFGIKRGAFATKAPLTRTELSAQSGLTISEIERSKRTFLKGIPDVVAAVELGKLTATASDVIAQLPKEDQPAALQEALQKKNGKNGSAKPKPAKKPETGHKKPIVARPPKSRKLTPEEIGLPPNATIEEQDAHQKRYGRVQTQPKVIFDLREADTLIGSYLMAIGNVISDTHPGPEAIFNYLHMLASWVPQPEKGEEYATNFAGKAKRFESLIDERLPIAVVQLTQFLSLWQLRKARS